MSLLSNFALGAAPVVGGALLIVAGGNVLSGLNLRSRIKDDIELLRVLPEDEVELRDALRQSIVDRVDQVIEANTKWRELRVAALSREDSWRDVVMFVSTVLFTIVWWYVDHDRVVWLPLFVMLVVATLLSALLAWRSLRSVMRRLKRTPGATG